MPEKFIDSKPFDNSEISMLAKEGLSISKQPIQHMGIPENLRKLRDNLSQARDEYNLGRYSEALDLLKKITSFEEPITHRAHLERKNQMESALLFASVRAMMGRTYERLDKKEDSQREMEKSVGLFGSVWRELEIKTGEYYGDYIVALYMANCKDCRDKAIKVFNEAVSSGMANAESYRIIGTLFLEDYKKEDGNFSKAEYIIRRKLQRDPAQKAEMYLRDALRLDPDDSIAYERLAKALEQQGKVDEAAKAQKDAKFASARLKEKTGHYKEALLDIDEALSFAKEDDDLDDLLETRGEILLELGRVEEALSSLQQALNKKKSSIYRRLLFSSALIRLERYEEALAEYDQIIGEELNTPLIFARVQRAVVLRALNRIDEAMKELLRCLDQSPYFPPAHIELGKTFYVLGQIDDALEKAEEALKLEPTNPDALSLKGKVLLNKGMVAEAEEIFRLLLEKHPGSVEITSQLADILKLLGSTEKALKVIDMYLDRSLDAHLLRSKVELLIFLERTNEALLAVDKLLSLEPENSDALVMKGKIILMLGKDPVESVGILEKALMINPESKSGYLALSNSLLSLKRFPEALNAAESALKLDPNMAAALTNKGLALMELERYQLAIESFDKSSVIQPDNIKMLWGRGESLRLLNRFEEALTGLRRAWKLAQMSNIPDEDKIKILHSGARSLLMLNRNDEALKMAEEGNRLDPHNSLLLADLALIYRFKGEYLRAKEYLDEAFKYDQKNASAWTLKAIMLSDLAEYQKALSSLERAIELGPKNEWNFAIKGWITLLLGADRCQEAKQMFDIALSLNPYRPNLFALYGHAHALRIAGSMEKARDEYRRVIDAAEKLGMMNANILAFLGMCYFYLRQYDEALRLLFNARSLSRNVSAIDSNVLAIRFELALILMCSGRGDQSLDQYNKCLRLVEAKKNIDYLGALYVALFDLKEAEREMPDLRAHKEFQRAKDQLRNAYEKIRAFNDMPYSELRN